MVFDTETKKHISLIPGQKNENNWLWRKGMYISLMFVLTSSGFCHLFFVHYCSYVAPLPPLKWWLIWEFSTSISISFSLAPTIQESPVTIMLSLIIHFRCFSCLFFSCIFELSINLSSHYCSAAQVVFPMIPSSEGIFVLPSGVFNSSSRA